MIPNNYACANCNANAIKLWCDGSDSDQGFCARCLESKRSIVVDLSVSVFADNYFPAILRAPGVPEFYARRELPRHAMAWWNALPLKQDGEWNVPGGVERWVTEGERIAECPSARVLEARMTPSNAHNPVLRLLVFIETAATDGAA